MTAALTVYVHKTFDTGSTSGGNLIIEVPLSVIQQRKIIRKLVSYKQARAVT